ncbi:glycosyl hydrolase family 28-related protein, partial [Ancylobacter polymorphus]
IVITPAGKAATTFSTVGGDITVEDDTVTWQQAQAFVNTLPVGISARADVYRILDDYREKLGAFDVQIGGVGDFFEPGTYTIEVPGVAGPKGDKGDKGDTGDTGDVTPEAQAAQAAAEAAAAQAALYEGVWLNDVAAVLADSSLTYSTGSPSSVTEGNYVRTRKEGISYAVAASGATDEHVSTAGGVKLYVVPGPKGYDVRAFGAAGDNTTDDTAAVQGAIDAAGSTLPGLSGVWANLAAVNAAVYVPQGRYKITAPLAPSHNLMMQGDGLGSQFWFDPATANADFIQPVNNTLLYSGLPGSNSGLVFKDFYVTVREDGGSTTGRNGSSLPTVNSNSRHAFNLINGVLARFDNVTVVNFHYGTAFRFSRGVEEGRTDLWAYYNSLVGCYARDCLLAFKPTSATNAANCYFGHSVNYPAQSRMAEHEYMVDFNRAAGCSLTGSVEGYASIALIRDNGRGHDLGGVYLESFPPTPLAVTIGPLATSAVSVSHGAMSYGYTYAKSVENLVVRSGSDAVNIGQNLGYGDCRELEIFHSATGQSPSFRDGLPGRSHSPTGGTISTSSTSFVGETAIVLARGTGTASTENGFTYSFKITGGIKLVSNIWVTCLVKFGGAESVSTVVIRNLTPPQSANFKKFVEYPNGWQLWGTYLTPGEDQTFTLQVRQLVGSTDSADTVSITALRAWVNGFDPILGPWQ